MVVFTPASDVWTLGYDEFDNICWLHKKTQVLYYIPPGQPLTLPPRRLTNMFRQNFPNTFPGTPTATARAEIYSLRGLGEAIHFNNSVLRAPETARVWPAIFVGYAQSHSLPMSRTADGKKWLPQTSLETGPRWNFPNDPYITTPTTVRPEASPHQGLGKGAHFNNSVLEVPEAARLQPASIVEDTKTQTRLPMSTADEKTHRLPPRSSANAPLPNLPPEPDIISTKEHARLPLLPGNDRGTYFDNSSTQKEPETARLRQAFIIEDTPHPPPQKSTTEDEKHRLPPTSSANAPLPNLPFESHLIPTTKDHDRESLLPGCIEGEHFDINSTLEQPDVARVKTASIVDDTKSHISPPLSKVEKPMLGSTPRSLVNTPESPHFIPAATESIETSLPRGDGEQGHLNNSALEVPEVVRVRIASVVKDTNPHISSVSRAENTESGLSPEISNNSSCSDALEDRTFTPASNTRTETSLLWEDEGDLFDSSSPLNVPEAVRVWPASIVDTMPHPSHPISRTEEAKQWSRERDIRGKEYYVNIITGESQYKKPNCLKKYTSRR